MPLVYKFPAVAWKTAANSRIMLAGSNLYGVGTLPGSLANPASKRIQSIYDVKAGDGAPVPRLVWTGHDGDPDDQESTTFHSAGIAFTILGNVYSGRHETTDEVDEICDRLVQLFHHQPLTMTGFKMREAKCRIVTIGEDPIGQHGIVEFESIIQVV